MKSEHFRALRLLRWCGQLLCGISFSLQIGLAQVEAEKDSVVRSHSFFHDAFFGMTERDSLAIRPQLTWVDNFIATTDFFILPVDDWGIKGVIAPAGLSPMTLQLYQMGLINTDPLFGQLPLPWLNLRADSLCSQSLFGLNLEPRFGKNSAVQSRFDYYRGDYGFLNFTLYADGQLSANNRWRVVGENLAYDGAYGLLGPGYSKSGESVSQTFRVDFVSNPVRQVKKSAWQVNLGTAYQKYMPGLIKPKSVGGPVLIWNHSGNLKEYRALLYVTASKQTSQRQSYWSAQLTNWIYGNYSSDKRYYFQGIGNQGNIVTKQEWLGRRWNWTLNFSAYWQDLFLRHRTDLHDRLVTGMIMVSQAYTADHSLAVGWQNEQFIYSLNYGWRLTERLNLGFNSRREYVLYPQIFRLDFPANRFLKQTGETFYLNSLELKYQHRRLFFSATLRQINAQPFFPFCQTYADTLIQYLPVKIDKPVFIGAFTYEMPWRTAIQGRIIANAGSNLYGWQGWGRLQQELTLFNGNLRLYFASEITYWDISNNWGWFDELRTFGQIGTAYFTNNRFNINGRIDGYIGDLHLFYLINNIEGRQFVTLSGMPYRYQLRIFGAEWTFLN